MTAVYAVVVWLLSGLFTGHWWIQFVCFALASYLMVEMNNIHALIRVYSRMVSCTFLVLSCCACFLFPSVSGAVMQLCFIGALTVLFTTYQDRQSAGAIYYAFLLIGLASFAFVQTLWYLPPLWLLMGTHLQSLSWRTWGASLLGLLTPYWFGALWMIWQEDFTPLADHFSTLIPHLSPLTSHLSPLTSCLTFFVLLSITGIVHYIRKHHDDKIRIRMIYGFFIWLNLLTIVLLLLTPQNYDGLLRIMIVTTTPLIAHFTALTSTRLTNAYCCVLAAIALLLTAYTLWTSSSLF